MAGTSDNCEDKSTVCDSQKDISLTRDSDTRLRDLDESKPSQEESRSQNKGENVVKKAPKETGSAQNNTEGNEAENTERSSSEGIYCMVNRRPPVWVYMGCIGMYGQKGWGFQPVWS